MSPIISLIVQIIILSVVVFLAAKLLPGVTTGKKLITPVIVAVLLGIVAVLIVPVLLKFLPAMNIWLFRVCLLVIYAAFVMLISALVHGFHVKNFVTGIIFSLVLVIAVTILSYLKFLPPFTF